MQSTNSFVNWNTGRFLVSIEHDDRTDEADALNGADLISRIIIYLFAYTRIKFSCLAILAPEDRRDQFDENNSLPV